MRREIPSGPSSGDLALYQNRFGWLVLRQELAGTQSDLRLTVLLPQLI